VEFYWVTKFTDAFMGLPKPMETVEKTVLLPDWWLVEQVEQANMGVPWRSNPPPVRGSG
jgi:hypothetical protein